MVKIIKDNPMDPAGCRTHRHASRDNLYKTWSSHTSHISNHVLAISHHNMPCKNKLDILYFVVANFTWLLRATSKNRSYLRKATTVIFKLLFNLLQGPPLSNPIQLKWERQTPAIHLYATSACQSMEPVSRTWTSKVGPSRFIPQYRRIKIRLRK